MSGDDTAVPLTQEQRDEALRIGLTPQQAARWAIITDHHAEHCGCDYDDCEMWADTAFVVDHVLEASPEVLAAAMGPQRVAEIARHVS